MPRKRLSDAERQERREKERQKFANLWRTKPSHFLRRIAAAYDWASDSLEFRGGYKSLAWQKALARQNLANYHLDGRPVTHNQGRIVYEMVRLGKYGGLNQDGTKTEELDITYYSPEELENLDNNQVMLPFDTCLQEFEFHLGCGFPIDRHDRNPTRPNIFKLPQDSAIEELELALQGEE